MILKKAKLKAYIYLLTALIWCIVLVLTIRSKILYNQDINIVVIALFILNILVYVLHYIKVRRDKEKQ